MKQITILLALLLLISCNKKETIVTTTIGTTSGDRGEEQNKKMKNEALTVGDEAAYGNYLEYCANHKPDEQLSFSLLFNHKHKTPKSYYWTFAMIIKLYNNNRFDTSYLQNLDKVNREFAFHYLLEGAKLNHKSSQMALEKIYRHGYGFEKHPAKSDSLYSLLEKDSNIGWFYIKHRNNKTKVDPID